MTFAQTAIWLGESLPWPDSVSAAVIDRLVRRTQRRLTRPSDASDADFSLEIEKLPIAVNTTEANAQHYEIPARFFELVLGPQRKYSCCLYERDAAFLAEAEERALQVTAEHARLADEQHILELGCGWGSLSLWMARRYPRSHITAVSNSASQREFIVHQARAADIS